MLKNINLLTNFLKNISKNKCQKKNNENLNKAHGTGKRRPDLSRDN
jgi:hypothetical protein